LNISKLTIASAVEARELREIGVLKAFMVVIQGAHHSRPRLREDQVALALSLNFDTALIQQSGLHAKEGE